MCPYSRINYRPRKDYSKIQTIKLFIHQRICHLVYVPRAHGNNDIVLTEEFFGDFDGVGYGFAVGDVGVVLLDLRGSI